MAGLENIVSRLVLNNITPIAKKTSSGTHAFTIMARILKDPAFGNKAQSSEASIYRDVLAANGDALVKYAEEWKLNISDPNDLKAKIEELVWMNAIIYGIGGWNEGDDFKADFFT